MDGLLLIGSELFLVSCFWFLVSGFWFLVSGFLFLVFAFSLWFQPSRQMVPGYSFLDD
jgi:hypothetical protein